MLFIDRNNLLDGVNGDNGDVVKILTKASISAAKYLFLLLEKGYLLCAKRLEPSFRDVFVWLPSGQLNRHTEVSASIQCLNKIRAMLLRETVEFINSAHLNLFEITIRLQQSHSINLLQLCCVCLQLRSQVPEPYVGEPQGDALLQHAEADGQYFTKLNLKLY